MNKLKLVVNVHCDHCFTEHPVSSPSCCVAMEDAHAKVVRERDILKKFTKDFIKQVSDIVGILSAQ